MEIERAFELQITVIPVLVSGAKMPGKNSRLPPEIVELKSCQMMEVRPDHRRDDQRRVAERLAGLGLRRLGRDERDDPPSMQQSRADGVLPKGLLSYDENDAEFFLSLLEGPTDINGHPPSVRYWKAGIESTDPAVGFRVGVIYGPSGSGKSSLVRAGILPILHSSIRRQVIEATTTGTEDRLREAISDHFGILNLGSLGDCARQLRETARTDGPRLIAIDQFEQWLHANPNPSKDTPLIRFLAGADGRGLKVLLVTRSDFADRLAVLFSMLAEFIDQRRNYRSLELFSQEHARRVLRYFGAAYEREPEERDLKKYLQFIERTVSELSWDGRVPPVHLSLVVQILRSRKWLPATLQELGGVEGIGVLFLEEIFRGADADPMHVRRAYEARQILAALLPEPSRIFEGRSESRTQLLKLSRLESKTDIFEETIRILDTDLHIVKSVPSSEKGGETCYALTHDYLVEPLRTWLTIKDRETLPGRARIHLRECESFWAAQRKWKNLPSFAWYITISFVVPASSFTGKQAEMMQAARRWYAAVSGVVTIFLLAIALLYSQFTSWVRADGAYRALLAAPMSRMAKIVGTEIPGTEYWIRPKLHALMKASHANQELKLKAALALLPQDPRMGRIAVEMVLSMSNKVTVACAVASCFSGENGDLKPELWRLVDNADAMTKERFVALILLAGIDRDDSRWKVYGDFIARSILEASADDQSKLREVFEWLAPALGPELQRVFRNPEQRPAARLAAARVLASYEKSNTALLLRLLLEGDPAQYQVIYSQLTGGSSTASISRGLDDIVSGRRDPTAVPDRLRGIAAVTYFQLGHRDKALSLIRDRRDLDALTHFVHGHRDRGVAAPSLAEQMLDGQNDELAQYALMLALGDHNPDDLPAETRSRISERLRRLYRTADSRAVHAAAGWLIRRWKLPMTYDVAKRDSLSGSKRGWFWQELLGTQWSFSVIPAGNYSIGSSETEQHHRADEAVRTIVIPYPVAFADREVSRGDFLRFLKATRRRFPRVWDVSQWTSDKKHPAVAVTWAEAVGFANWLTVESGMSASDVCYRRGRVGRRAWRLKERCAGFRLPTESEWEVACRAGTETAYSFGDDSAYVASYGWFVTDSGRRSRVGGLLAPNLYGLFDMHGNVFEWCSDWYSPGAKSQRGQVAREFRSVRGGAWPYLPATRRCAFRGKDLPTRRTRDNGFRVVRSLTDLREQASPR